MAEIINGYTVSYSNSSKVNAQRSSARVKRDGVLLALVYSDTKSGLLHHIRTRPQSESRKDFVAQLRENAVPESHIQEILKIPKNNA